MKQCQECQEEVNILRQNRCQKCYNAYYNSQDFSRKFPPLPDKLSSFQLEVLDGLMLGDGCLFLGKNRKNPVLKVGRALKDKDYLIENFNVFKDFCLREPEIYDHLNEETGKVYKKICFDTRASSVFLEIYNRWYTDGIKQVPKDLKLTPLIIAIWLADDGTVYPSSKKSKHRINLKLYSNGFSKSDNEFLVRLLVDRYDEQFSIIRDNKKKKTYYYIFGNNNASRKLLNDIDDIFPSSMIRKTYWRNPEARFYHNIPVFRENLKNIVDKRLNQMIDFLKINKCGTPSEIAAQLGWFHREKGILKPSRVDANNYLKKLVGMNLVYREEKRDNKNNKGYVFHWIGE